MQHATMIITNIVIINVNETVMTVWQQNQAKTLTDNKADKVKLKLS